MACTAARESASRPRDELALYVVHGLLHLCGYDDHGDAAAAAVNCASGIFSREVLVSCC